jgi:hypothetical protein
MERIMAKKKYRPTNRSVNTENIQPQASPRAAAAVNKVIPQLYNAEKYIKRDVLWTLVTAAIVVVVGVILYYVFK